MRRGAARVLLLGAARTLLLAAAPSGCGPPDARDSAAAGGEAARGARLYSAQGCATCHGEGGSGGMLGPTLRGVAPLWTRSELVLFLADPHAFAERSPRIAEQERRFLSPMQSFRALSEKDRAALADFVMSLR
jgi:mono/diheme cytochrome c family protein